MEGWKACPWGTGIRLSTKEVNRRTHLRRLSRNRRMSKDYERKDQTSEILIEVAMIRPMLARMGKRP
jgi:hypothetical protein